MRLFLLFLIVPLIEIALFIQVGGVIGMGWTLLIVVLTAILGTILVRSQGLAVLNRLKASMESLHDPTEPLAHGAMILFSGALLLTPGFFTDAVGFALLIPGVRSSIFDALRKRIVASEFRYGDNPQTPPEPEIIEGDFKEVEPTARDQGPSGWTRH